MRLAARRRLSTDASKRGRKCRAHGQDPALLAPIFAICEHHGQVWVISKRRLREFWQQRPDAERRLSAWYQVVSAATWSTSADLRRTFPSTAQVGRPVVFNVGGNNYRVIARIEFATHKVFIRHVLTHAEYSTNVWQNDPWY